MDRWIDQWMDRRMDGWIDRCMEGWIDKWMNEGGQLSRVFQAFDLGAEGPRFEPWQQLLVQLS